MTVYSVETFSVWSPLKEATLTCVTRGYSLLTLSSSSFRRRANRTRTRKGTFLTPWDHKCLLRRVSILTSVVPICFSANFLTSLMARGARYLKPMPWSLLWRLMVYSRVSGIIKWSQDPAKATRQNLRNLIYSQHVVPKTSERDYQVVS